MKVLVCGSRDFHNEQYLFRAMDWLHAAFGITLVIQGGATGADKLAKKWAISRGVDWVQDDADWEDITVPGAVVVTRPDGTKYNKAAGAMRNRKMADRKPQLGAAFSNDIFNSRGTMDMCAVLAERHIPYMTFPVALDAV